MPNHGVIGLLGHAGVGKDTVAEMIAPVHLVELDGALVDIRALLRSRAPRGVLSPTPPENALRPTAVQIALADPLKEFCYKVYDFTLEQLWGPSAARNAPDKRYSRQHSAHAWGPADTDHPDGAPCTRCGQVNPLAPIGVCTDYLTPREALQQLGTEWGRQMHADTWVRMALRRAARFTELRIQKPGADAHTFAPNWVIEQHNLVVVSDVRFLNEVAAFASKGHEVWRILDPDPERLAGAPTNGMHAHLSETEQLNPAIDQGLTLQVVNDKREGYDALRRLVAGALERATL